MKKVIRFSKSVLENETDLEKFLTEKLENHFVLISEHNTKKIRIVFHKNKNSKAEKLAMALEFEKLSNEWVLTLQECCKDQHEVEIPRVGKKFITIQIMD